MTPQSEIRVDLERSSRKRRRARCDHESPRGTPGRGERALWPISSSARAGRRRHDWRESVPEFPTTDDRAASRRDREAIRKHKGDEIVAARPDRERRTIQDLHHVSAARRITVQQPRRIAARSLPTARQELRTRQGSSAQIRFRTRPPDPGEVMTDGVMLAETHSDASCARTKNNVEEGTRGPQRRLIRGYMNGCALAELKVCDPAPRTERLARFFDGAR